MNIASIDAYERLATFETIDQLNEAVRYYKSELASKLSKTERAVLDILHRYSAKYTGVSFLRKSKIAEMIGKSRRTIIRVCQRLEALDIIRQYEFVRPSDKRQTSNAIVIQPVKLDDVVHNVTPEPSENVTPKKTTSPLKQLHKDKRTYRPAWIPEGFFELLSQHFGNVEEITDYWRAVHAVTCRYTFMTKEVREELGTAAFMEMKSRRKKLRKQIAYFVGVVKRMTERRYVVDLFNDWFDAD